MDCIFLRIITCSWRTWPFNLEHFAVNAKPQSEKTLSDGVDVAVTHNHFFASSATQTAANDVDEQNKTHTLIVITLTTTSP
jgi:hypothetical protein